MRNKELVLRKLEELENKVKVLDGLYGRAGTQYEKEQIYSSVKEKIEEITTLINTEFQD